VTSQDLGQELLKTWDKNFSRLGTSYFSRLGTRTSQDLAQDFSRLGTRTSQDLGEELLKTWDK
jgi:hypothetical protein